MRLLRSMARSLSLVLALCQLPALASGFDEDFEEKPWEEAAVQLPAFPEEANLIPFRVGSRDDIKYLVDGASLSVGSDGVVRYTVLVVSEAGGQNVSYEGMRCATAERRLYAFGRSDKTWSKARNNQWVRIRGGSNNHVVELFANYFCKPSAPALTGAEDARRVLRGG